MSAQLDRVLAKLDAEARDVDGPDDLETPPLDAYADEERAAIQSEPPSAEAAKSRFILRRAIDVASTLPRAAWRLRPFLERNAIVFLYGDYETYKSFVAIDWALRIALGMPAMGYQWFAERVPVVFISAEGRGLAARLRGWCIRNLPREDWRTILDSAALYCIEHPVNLSDASNAVALVAEIAKLGVTPGAVFIDTMTRNSDGQIENSTADATAYLAIIDQHVRSPHQSTVVLTHHVGHGAKERMRGPIVLAANTDALIRIERPDRNQRLATLTVERLKDSPTPEPRGIKAEVVEIGEQDDDGQPITTLALSLTDAPGPSSAQVQELKGKAQRKLLTALREIGHGTVWSLADLREIGRETGIHRSSVRTAAESLTFTPHLKATVGGWMLADDPLFGNKNEMNEKDESCI